MYIPMKRIYIVPAIEQTVLLATNQLLSLSSNIGLNIDTTPTDTKEPF